MATVRREVRRERRARFQGIGLAVALGCGFTAGTAWGDQQASFQLGDQGWAEVDAGGELEISFNANAGDRLDLLVKAWRGSETQPALLMLGPDDQAIDLTDFVKTSKKGNRVKLARFVAPATGLYRCTIADVGDGAGGGFDFSSKLKPARKFGGTLEASRTRTELPFTAYAGDRARLTVKTKRKGPSIRIADLVQSDGVETRFGLAGKTPWTDLTAAGEHAFRVEAEDDVEGTFRYKISVKPRKGSKARDELRPHIATTTVSGRLLVPGHTESSDRGGAGKRPRFRKRAEPIVVGDVIVGGELSGESAVRRIRRRLPGLRCRLERSLTPTGPHLIELIGWKRRTETRRDQARTRTIARALRDLPGVDWVETNGRVAVARAPNDPLYPSQRYLRTINLEEAWEYTVGSPSVVVAVIDTGIWARHPAFEGRLVQGYDFVSDIDNSADADGWDFDPEDDAHNYHGTHVAGIIGAAGDDSSGVTGVVWNARIQPVRALGHLGGEDFDIAAAIRWSAGLPVEGAPPNATPARVINMSLGGYRESELIEAACQDAYDAGAFLVAAAGNDGTTFPAYPASYDSVVSVGALGADLRYASYSNYGNTLTICAPGGDFARNLGGILSTYVSNDQPVERELQGTSMAAPQVAGVAALLLSVQPTLTPFQLEKTIADTAIDLGPYGFDIDYGWGMIDAEAMLDEWVGGGSKPARLVTTPAALTILGSEPTGRIRLTNGGDGDIDIDEVRVRTKDRKDWLQVTLTENTTPALLELTVDMGLAPSGVGQAEITILTSANDIRYPVRLLRLAPPVVGQVVVEARDAQGELVAAAVTDPDSGFEFELGPLPKGSYHISAHLDRNGDGAIDQVSDWFGEYPVTGLADVIEVDPQEPPNELEFSLARIDSEFDYLGVGGGAIRGAIASRVTDALTGEPIPAAEFVVGEKTITTRTDADGRAVVFGNISGRQLLTARAEGYETKTIVDVDAQFVSFELEPLIPETLTVDVELTGLGTGDALVRFRVGNETVSVAHGGAALPAQAQLTPERAAGRIPVRCMVFDSAGRLTGAALTDFEGSSAPDAVSYSLAVQPVTLQPGGATTVTLPTVNFTPAGTELGYEVLRSVTARDARPIGLDDLTPRVEGIVSWAMDAAELDAPAFLHLAATDAFGRSTLQRVAGTVGDIEVPEAVELPAPVELLAPVDHDDAPIHARLAWRTGASAHAYRIDIEQLQGTERWSLLLPSSASSINLPRLESGGLRDRSSYRWRVVGILSADFAFDDHRAEELGIRARTVTSSEWREFTVDD